MLDLQLLIFHAVDLGLPERQLDLGGRLLLWSIQDYRCYQTILSTGVLQAKQGHEKYLLHKSFIPAYKWMITQMDKKGIKRPLGAQYPVWAWHSFEGWRKRPDMRQGGWASRGAKIVRLAIDINEENLLLSDFEGFHSVLNYGLNSKTEKEWEEFEKEYMSLGYNYHDLSDFSIQENSMIYLRKKIEDSWQNIFDIELEPEPEWKGSKETRSVQACFWTLKREQILEAEVFIAR